VNSPRSPILFDRLGGVTQARIGLGRAGNALPTAALLEFQLAHARARDAVHAALDVELLAAQLGVEHFTAVRSQAADRSTFLQQPDLGRWLDPSSRTLLPPGPFEAAIVLADGLSATAVHAHAVPLYREIFARLPGWTIAPPIAALQARVALGDDIGEALGSELIVMLIGERPGLSAADSLGVYLTWQPRRGRLDSERNCISNVRPPHGTSYADAADLLAWLMQEARRRRLTGVALKVEHELPPGRLE
jgi:ethanolamine ammonia-lyase small subunit